MHALVNQGTSKLEKSDHALLRSAQGRPVPEAISDLIRARPADILSQGDGRWVIRGANGRTHIVEADGSQVLTSFRNTSANTQFRILKGTWNPLTNDQIELFKAIFKGYVRW